MRPATAGRVHWGAPTLTLTPTPTSTLTPTRAAERVYWKHTPSPLRRPSTPDPNSLQDASALEHWLKLSDPYVFPHIQYFDSADDLAAKLATADLKAISGRMRRHSAEVAPIMVARVGP